MGSTSAALYTLSGTLDLSTATFNFGGATGAISGTYDDVTNEFSLMTTWSGLITVGADATVRQGPATIGPANISVVDLTGNEGFSDGSASVANFVLSNAEQGKLTLGSMVSATI